MADRIEWAYTAATSRFVRAATYAGFGLLGGLAVIAVVGGVALVVGLAVAGNLAALALVGLLLLVGGPYSLLYLAPMLTDPAQRPPLPADSPLVMLSARRLALASVAAGVVLVASGLVAPWLPIAVFVVGVLVLLPVVAALTTEGAADPDAGTLTVNGREVALADLQGVRRARLGAVVLAWLSYGRGTATGVPRFVAVPRPVWAELAPALRAGVRTETESDDGLSRQVRTVLVGIGLGTLALAVGAGFLAVTRHGAGAVFGYAAAFAVVFGALFLWVGTT